MIAMYIESTDAISPASGPFAHDLLQGDWYEELLALWSKYTYATTSVARDDRWLTVQSVTAKPISPAPWALAQAAVCISLLARFWFIGHMFQWMSTRRLHHDAQWLYTLARKGNEQVEHPKRRSGPRICAPRWVYFCRT